MKWIASNRGSSSILVALALIMLVVFAVLAVATSAADLRLAKKNAETVRIYYSLDSEGERFLNAIYAGIRQGRDKAEAAICAAAAGELSSAGLPESISKIIGETLASLADSGARQQYLDDLYPKLATYYAMNAITEAYPGCVYSQAADYLDDAQLYGTVPAVLSFGVRKTFVLEYEGNPRYLNVDIVISDPERDRDPAAICDIREWRLWQEPFEYGNEIDLWEGRP